MRGLSQSHPKNSFWCVCSVYNEYVRKHGERMDSREIIRRLQQDGWFEVAHEGNHKQFKHSTKPGRVTVPTPRRDVPVGTLRSIEKQAGIKLR
jgi:predicted RNA binding protein YcfA (HicA-like mRNA interferase family)